MLNWLYFTWTEEHCKDIKFLHVYEVIGVSVKEFSRFAIGKTAIFDRIAMNIYKEHMTTSSGQTVDKCLVKDPQDTRQIIFYLTITLWTLQIIILISQTVFEQSFNN